MTADGRPQASAGPTTGAAPQAGAASRRCYSFPDLGATIDCDDFSADLARELPDRYDSCFCVAEYFDIYDRPENVSTCQLDEPRHVVVFTVKGATAEILNKVVDIEPDAVERVTTAIFRAHPQVHRIRAEIKFPPAELRRPARQLLRADDFVVTLPATIDEYNQSIGSTTRKHLRQYGNGLVRRHPDFALSTLERSEIPRELVDQVIAWHLERMRAKGVVSLWEETPDAPEQLWRLLQAYGCALCGSIEGRYAAAQLLLFVGRDGWVHTVGFDSAYENEHLGLLMTSYSIAESIRRGCAQTHLTWGTDVYKRRLGAVPVPAYRVSIYRSRLWKTLYRRERWALLVKHRRDVYWKARTALTARLPHVARWCRGLKTRLREPGERSGPGRPPIKEP
jgi:hypothetical protein